MSKRPLFFIFLALCAGIWIANFFHIPFLFEEITPVNHIKNFIGKEPIETCVGAVIVTDPVSHAAQCGMIKTTFTAQALSMYVIARSPEGATKQTPRSREIASGRSFGPRNDNIPVCGLINVISFDDRDAELRYGDYVLIKGALSRPLSLHNPGSVSFTDYLMRQGVYSAITVRKGDFISLIKKAEPKISFGNIFALKRRFQAVIGKYMPSEEGYILSGVLLGDRSLIERDLKDKFIKTGTVHVLPAQYTKLYPAAF